MKDEESVETPPPSLTTSGQSGFIMASELHRPKRRLAYNSKTNSTIKPVEVQSCLSPSNSTKDEGSIADRCFEGFKLASSILVKTPPPSLNDLDSTPIIIEDRDSNIEALPNATNDQEMINDVKIKKLETFISNSTSECRDPPSSLPSALAPSSFDDTLVDLTRSVLLSRKRTNSPDDMPSPKRVLSR